MRKVVTTEEKKIITAKLIKVLANAPICEAVSKADSKRVMFSLKTKRKVAKYAAKHNLKASVLASVYPHISTQMVGAWIRDNKADKFHLRNAVSVSRAQ